MIETIDIGDQVLCDGCTADFTNRTESGGFLFGSKAVCPDCAPALLVDLKKGREDKFIKAFCPPWMSFRDWCLMLRGGDNTIRIRSGEDLIR